MNPDHEVLVVGAGPAGLGAAMALGRLRRTALVCDDGRPRNKPAAHMHNFPGAEGMPPLEWRERARADVERYPTIRFQGTTVEAVEAQDGGFAARLASGDRVRVKKIVLAHGIQDKLPAIPGLRDLWGSSVFHCPFCHGYENRDGKLGIIANATQAMHALPMLHGLTSDLILFTSGQSDLTREQRATLERRGVGLIEGTVERVVHENGELRGVLVDGRLVTRTAILVAPLAPYRMTSVIGESLGCAKTEMGLYAVSEGNRTSLPGVYAAGDNMSGMQSVLAACAAGQLAGATAARDLLQEAFSR